MRGSSVALAGAVAFVAATQVSAHRLDELLQAARIGIAEDRVDVELDLTPGAAVADRVIADIDRDADGVFSNQEQRAFVEGVMSAITMNVDETRLQLSSTTFTFPEASTFRTGDGVIAIRARAPLSVRSAGAHHLTINNAFRPEISVYLANALVPDTDRIAVTAQDRDSIQSRLTIAYESRPQSPTALPYLIVAAIVVVGVLALRHAGLLQRVRARSVAWRQEQQEKGEREERGAVFSISFEPRHRN